MHGHSGFRSSNFNDNIHYIYATGLEIPILFCAVLKRVRSFILNYTLMEVICLEETAFYELVEQVVARLGKKQADKNEKWLNDVEAMKLLNVTSKTTMQKLRDEGKIRFSQPQKKIILYDHESIMTYLDKNARNTF